MSPRRNPIREVSAVKKSSPAPSNANVAVAHIRIGSYYEIDHSVLPQKSPDQLKSIRIVMVSKITSNSVSLRYPSTLSLRSYFDRPNRNKPGGLLPDLDESHVVAAEVAGELLYRRIPPHEVSTNRNNWGFWVTSPYSNRLRRGSEMMMTWGRRMRVQYQSRHIDNKEESRKRKLIEESTKERAAKRGIMVIDEKKETQIVVYKKKSDRKFIDRWSMERYKLAEKNMLKLMKEKNAVFGNFILRSELRLEARKLIGDTGLLDHLLKHMAGKVAPGGEDRFRRKHNADGAMVYWLESADLIHVRKEAGVEDPYWTPPPGWKLGDNPTQDPVCAGEIREIKQGLATLKREVEKLTLKKEEEEELLVMATPNSCVTSQNVDHDNLMTPAKEIYANLLKKKYKIEDQLVLISDTLRKMEEDMGRLNCPIKAPDSTELTLLLEDSPTMKTLVKEVMSKDNQQRSPLSLISKTGFTVCKPVVGSFSWPKLPALSAAVTDNAEFASLPSYQPTPPPCPVKPLAAKHPVVFPFPCFTINPPETSSATAS